ncbi:MAG: glycosyltransferase family 2 protein [Treponema sp.]|nr:glycosyltransferase family 2 protein [Treponema sp.]
MSSSPLVSVIIPCYNAERYVESAVRSIMEQTYTNLEILCCDDCSTDGTLPILQKLAAEDSRIKILRNEANLGVVDTLNKLVSEAAGVYIARMDADDISLPKRIEKQVAFLEKHNDIAICGCNVIHIDETDLCIAKTILPVTKYGVQKMKAFRTPFYHPAVIIRTSILKSNKYEKEFQYAEDYELWLRLLENNEGVNLKCRLLLYRIHNQQISKNKTIAQISLLKKIYSKYTFGIITTDFLDSYANYVAANQKDSKTWIILTKLILKTHIFLSPLLLLSILHKFFKRAI